jgi:hypothetical protein
MASAQNIEVAFWTEATSADGCWKGLRQDGVRFSVDRSREPTHEGHDLEVGVKNAVINVNGAGVVGAGQAGRQ